MQDGKSQLSSTETDPCGSGRRLLPSTLEVGSEDNKVIALWQVVRQACKGQFPLSYFAWVLREGLTCALTGNDHSRRLCKFHLHKHIVHAV